MHETGDALPFLADDQQPLPLLQLQLHVDDQPEIIRRMGVRTNSIPLDGKLRCP